MAAAGPAGPRPSAFPDGPFLPDPARRGTMMGGDMRPSTAPAGPSASTPLSRPGTSLVDSQLGLSMRSSMTMGARAPLGQLSAAVLDKIPEPPARRALQLTEVLVDKIVVRLKTEYNDMVLDGQKKELMLTKIAEEARSGAARLDEMHAGMVETVALRARMRDVEDDVARLVDQSHILGHVLSRIRDEYMHDQAEVDGIRNELEQAKKAQEVVAMRTIEAREKQFLAREQLATKRSEMDAAQATWVSELTSLRSMNIEEIQILKDFQFRKESRKKIPLEVEEELSSIRESRAIEGYLEDQERQKREEAVQMRADIMQSTIDKLLAISGATSVEELVAFFEEKELRRQRTMTTMSEREAKLTHLASELASRRNELQEIRFFASHGLSIDDSLRRQVELAEVYEEKASGYVLKTSKAVALTASLLSGFIKSLTDRLSAAGFDFSTLRPLPPAGRGNLPRASLRQPDEPDSVRMQNAAEERERLMERRRRVALHEAFAERRARPVEEPPNVQLSAPGPADGVADPSAPHPHVHAPPRRPSKLLLDAVERPATPAGDAPAPPATTSGASLREDDVAVAEASDAYSLHASARLDELMATWEREHADIVHLLLEVEQKLDGPMTSLGIRPPDSRMEEGTAESAAKRRVARMSSLSHISIARQNLQVVMDVEDMIKTGRDRLPSNNTRVNPAIVDQMERDKEIVNWLLENQPALRRRLHESMMDTIATLKDLTGTCCSLGLDCTTAELQRVFALPEMRANGSSSGKFDMAEFLTDSDTEEEKVMVSRVDIKSHTAKLLRTKGMGESEKDAKDKRKKTLRIAENAGPTPAGGGGMAARSLSTRGGPAARTGSLAGVSSAGSAAAGSLQGARASSARKPSGR